MKSSRKPLLANPAARALAIAAVSVCAWRAAAELPTWMREAVSGSAIEAALYQWMDLPAGRTLYPRPPADAARELKKLSAKDAANAELFMLRAQSQEQSLDFDSAEASWKQYAAHAPDQVSAKLQLADFYNRRLRAADEVRTLMEAGALPPAASEKFTPATKQQSWLAFERILRVAEDQAMPDDVVIAAYRAWVARYPADTTVRARQIQSLLDKKQFEAAEASVADYRRAFAGDAVRPVQFTAQIAQQRGSAEAALGVYDTAYQPLWPAELVQSYFALLHTTHRERAWLADSRAQLQKNPDDLRSVTRIFYYLQQQRRLQEAADTFTAYAQSKQQRKAAWTADELYTFATLLESVHVYADSARFYFALHSATGTITGTSEAPEAIALSGLTRILLTVPEQPIALGAGNLSIYRDIAAVDQGPGYWNGILSLWLNSESPSSEMDTEEDKARPYFHRAKAAELLKVLDAKYPSSPSRPSLQLALLRAYAEYGQHDAVLKIGEQFLAQFPSAKKRMAVASAMADAYAQTSNTAGEFAMYDRMLAELSEHADRMPLTQDASQHDAAPAPVQQQPGPAADNATEETTGSDVPPPPPPDAPEAPSTPVPAADITYAQVLERYLGRLTTSNKLPQAVAVFRREIDRNPNDPLLYERLAAFLQQNNLAAQQEEVYRTAISRFKDESWYSKLARFYIRQQQRQAFENITKQVVDTFHGTELATYFQQSITTWPEVSLQVNLYAHQRFPHELQFTRNLLYAYEVRPTSNAAEWEKLMREHWFEADDLRSRFFEHLSSGGKLESEIASLEKLAGTSARSNPAASHELAEAQLWRSHFEEGAPLLGALSDLYPANETIGEQATSVYRSLAYFDPAATARAIRIQQRLHLFAPGNTEHTTTLGDIYGDRAQRDEDPAPALAHAAQWFRQIPTAHPGSQKGYLDSATVFWDYFQFDDALAQIAAARQRFHNPSLFGYEAGAIYEARRQCPLAVAEYIQASVSDPETRAASNRLQQLANRKSCGEEVNTQTAKLVAGNTTIAALHLRADILNAQGHKSQVAPLLETAIANAKSEDEASKLAEYAQSSGLRAQYRHALQRQADLAVDPVTKIEVRYSLVNALLADNDYASAQTIIHGVYQDNPKILGVVRRTTDFYWSNKHPREAVATLVQAAHDATPDLALTLQLEASSKAAQSGDAAEARRIANLLLAADPNDARYIHAVAESYAAAHDDAGLRDFYAAQIAAAAKAQLTRDDRRDRVATLRRGLIPALVSIKDYAGATDQYIELLNAYPEDADLTAEAARFTLRYNRQQQLIAHLDRTVASSPRDSRFSIMLARVQTVFGNIPQAIDAYSKAIAIRKDRIDVYTSKVELEERTQRFDEAASDYDRLYLLSYHDPSWKVKQAETYARQGKAELAVKALKTAWIDGKPASAANQFRVAEQLETWNFLSEAEQFGREGIRIAGDDLLALPEFANGAKVYARILTRERKSGDAMSTLKEARKQANISPSSPTAIAQQVQKEGILSVTDADWRRRLVQQRHEQAEAAFASCLTAMGATVATFYTPEEKLTYAQMLDAERANQPPSEVASIWIPAASAAALLDREAEWRKSLLVPDAQPPAKAAVRPDPSQLQPLIALERRRMQNAELAATLESYAASLPAARRTAPLTNAQEAWQADGNQPAEMRVLASMHLADDSLQPLRERYFNLLLHNAPDRIFAQLNSRPAEYAQSAGNFILSNGTASQALRAVNTLGTSLGPLWKNSNAALTGLYFVHQLTPAERTATDTAFASTLDTRTIGERILGKDTTTHITGDEWFRYATRYGVFRASANTGDADDYLPAGLEHAPGVTQSYIALAAEYEDAGRPADAIIEYTHALELTPNSASTERKLARILWKTGKQAEAVDHWSRSAHILRALVDVVAVPESFWTDFAALNADVRQYHPQASVENDIDEVLHAYLAKNGNYRSAELLRARYASPRFNASDLQRLFSMAQAARYPAGVVTQLEDEPWISESLRGAFFQREIELIMQDTSTAHQTDDWTLNQARRKYMAYLLRHDQFDDAERLLNSMAEAQRASEFGSVAVRIAIHKGSLDQLLATYAAQSPTENQLKELSQTAAELTEAQRPAKRTLLAFVYDQRRTSNTLNAPDMLALAAVDLDLNDTASALDLLRSVTLLPGDPYANFDSAATLLEEKKKLAEAIPFLQVLAHNTPWNAAYRVRLAQAEFATNADYTAATSGLAHIASDSSAPYKQRLDAAETIGRFHLDAAVQGSAELQLIARGAAVTADEAGKPYFVAARIKAAESAQSPKARAAILREAIAVDPQDDVLRLKLFQSEYAAGEFNRALAAIEPILGNGYTSISDGGNAGTEAEQDAEESQQAPQENRPQAYAPTPPQLRTMEERRQFAEQMSNIYEKLRDLQQALLYARASASQNNPEPSDRRIQRLTQQIHLEQLNSQRRPRLGKDLHQAVAVRPKLLASRKEATP